MAIIHLLNSGVTVDTDYTDNVWENGCCWALIYRLGFNNATRIADMVDADTYGRLPVANKGVMLVGASENPYEEPGFEAYVARLQRSVVCHFLHTKYGIDTLPDGMEASCQNRQNVWRDVNDLAERFMQDRVLPRFIEGWTQSVRGVKEQFGNLFESIVVPTYERRTGKRYVPRDWEDPAHPGIPRPKQAAPAPAPAETPASAAPQPASTSPAPKFCSNCGSPLSPGAKFCSNCGNRIG